MSKKFKVLNLYACLGGNRYKWDEVANIEVTAVELDSELASMYQKRFPSDKVIIANAHQYLLDHYKEFDFIWSSPPCPTHSRARYWVCKSGETKTKLVYPDMTLYEEIIFLEHYTLSTQKWVVENVIPYYKPLIPAQKRGRHLYWANFTFPQILSSRKSKISSGKNEVKKLCEFHEFDFYKYKGEQRLNKIARNLVDYEAGKTIFSTAINIIEKSKIEQGSLFEKF